MPPNLDPATELYLKDLDQKITMSIDRQKEAGQGFDKQVVYIAGGGLAITLSFAKDIIGFTGKSFVFLLLLSWLSFGLSLFLNLLSHRAATKLYDALANIHLYYREKVSSQKEVDESEASTFTRTVNSNSKQVEWLNDLSLYSVALGILSFIFFTFTSFFSMPSNSNSPVQHGESLNKAVQPDLIKGLPAPAALMPTPPPTVAKPSELETSAPVTSASQTSK